MEGTLKMPTKFSKDKEGNGSSFSFILFLFLIYIFFSIFYFGGTFVLGSIDEKYYFDLIKKQNVSKVTVEDYKKFKLEKNMISEGYYRLLYFDGYGEISSNQIVEMHNDLVNKNENLSNGFNYSLKNVYSESFDKMQGRLGIPNFEIKSLEDLVNKTININQISIFDKFEMIQRYGLTMRYSEEELENNLSRLKGFINNKRYLTATPQELLFMAGSSYTLIASSNLSENPELPYFAMTASSLFLVIVKEGVESPKVKKIEQSIIDVSSKI